MKKMRKLKCCVVSTIVVLLVIAGMCGILFVKAVLSSVSYRRRDSPLQTIHTAV